MRYSSERCSRRLLRQSLLSVPDAVVTLARVVVALAHALDGLVLQIAPAAGPARRPQQKRRDADADDHRGDRSRIFLRRVVSASVAGLGLISQVGDSLSHLHASMG